MLYEFVCDSCGRVQDVARRVSQRDGTEDCTCGELMHRVFSFRGQINVREFQACFHPAFGKRIGSKGELQNELARYKDEKGSELIEVGNEQLKMSPKKPTISEEDHRAAIKEYTKCLS